MLYTNTKNHGGEFSLIFDEEVQNSQNTRIASGYFSLDILQKYEELFIEKSRSNQCQILLGMAFYEGLTQKKFEVVKRINDEMRKTKTNSGFYVTNGRKYHGKIFQINGKTYLGSSNFSSSGFKGNIEATILCSNEQENKINLFLDELFSTEHSIKVEKAEIPIKGKRKLIGNKAKGTWDTLKRHRLKETSLEVLNDQKVATIDLLRLAEKEKSNLNIFFGKGRENMKTHIIAPRPWYEFEIIVSKTVTANKNYPKGNFLAYTDDGYIMPMKTSGDFKKNLRSAGGLQVFGRWFKGRLENAGHLEKFTQITPETLLEYGKTNLCLYKMKKEGSYYLTWK